MHGLSFRVNLAAIALELSKREAPERYPAGTKIDGVNVGGQFIPKDKQDEWEMVKLSRMKSSDVSAFAQNNIPGLQTRLKYTMDRVDEVAAGQSDIASGIKEGFSRVFDTIVGVGETIGEELSLFASEFEASIALPSVGFGLAGGMLMRLGMAEAAAKLKSFFAGKMSGIAIRLSIAALNGVWGAGAIVGGTFGTGLLFSLWGIHGLFVDAYNAFRGYQMDSHLRDPEGIVEDEKAIREAVTDDIKKIDYRAVHKKIDPIAAGFTDAIDAIVTSLPDGIKNKIVFSDYYKKIMGIEPYSLFQYEYDGVKYSAETKEDLIDTVSYYGARVKRLPKAFREALPAVHMMGSALPDWLKDVRIIHDMESLLIGRFAAAYVAEPDSDVYVMSHSPLSTLTPRGIQTIAHETGHSFAVKHFGSAYLIRDNRDYEGEVSQRELLRQDPEITKLLDEFREISLETESPVSRYANFSLLEEVEKFDKISKFFGRGPVELSPELEEELHRMGHTAEDFAESCRYYFANPERMERIAPDRYRIIYQIMHLER